MQVYFNIFKLTINSFRFGNYSETHYTTVFNAYGSQFTSYSLSLSRGTIETELTPLLKAKIEDNMIKIYNKETDSVLGWIATNILNKKIPFT